MELITTQFRLWLCYSIFLCSKDTQPSNFTKCHVVRKLNYKRFVHIFRNLRIRFFLISWLDYKQLWKEYKKKEHNQHSSVLQLSYCSNVQDLLIISLIFIFLSSWKSSWWRRSLSWKFKTLLWKRLLKRFSLIYHHFWLVNK